MHFPREKQFQISVTISAFPFLKVKYNQTDKKMSYILFGLPENVDVLALSEK